MYLDAEQYKDAQALACDILKEHPTNALAWATKGLTCLVLVKKYSNDAYYGASKCLETARRSGSGIGFMQKIFDMAGPILLQQAQSDTRNVLYSFADNDADPLNRQLAAIRTALAICPRLSDEFGRHLLLVNKVCKSDFKRELPEAILREFCGKAYVPIPEKASAGPLNRLLKAGFLGLIFGIFGWMLHPMLGVLLFVIAFPVASIVLNKGSD
jgi:hypothetical protein